MGWYIIRCTGLSIRIESFLHTDGYSFFKSKPDLKRDLNLQIILLDLLLLMVGVLIISISLFILEERLIFLKKDVSCAGTLSIEFILIEPPFQSIHTRCTTLSSYGEKKEDCRTTHYTCKKAAIALWSLVQ